jgi:ADP-heptose:LPS heptosyltransferase|tara:strand:+ start:39 stop:1121 length:1083 start_codon:yes stop_codon:yes gene_type:complete
VKIIKVPEKEIEDFTPEDFGGVRKEKTVCVIRYGAFGDILQTSSVLPLLKDQGYKVCINTQEVGKDILRSNPYVDELLVQRTNQIPLDRLTEYWEKFNDLFDKVIQFSESVEGSLLLVGDRTVELKDGPALAKGDERFLWDKERIHSECNVNYLEKMHDIAGVEHVFCPLFYPTKKEQSRMRDWKKKKVKTKHLVMNVLSGSSVHKVWPWNDSLMARFLDSRKDVTFITVGDIACQLLEQGWEKESRVITTSGEWPIRDVLTLAKMCTVVLGPETGVLNSISSLDRVHKSLFLSHSSKENLSKHWKNTTSFEPFEAECYPCHKMHHGFDTCTRDEETGGSLCASKIQVGKVYMDIAKNLK